MNLTVSFNLNLPFAAASGSQTAEKEEDYDLEADDNFAPKLQEDESLGNFDMDNKARKLVIWKPALKTWLFPIAKRA